jgi:hypothetical protein
MLWADDLAGISARWPAIASCFQSQKAYETARGTFLEGARHWRSLFHWLSRSSLHMMGAAASSLQNVILERDAFTVAFLKPPFGGFPIGEHLEVINVAGCLRSVDVNEYGHRSLASFAAQRSFG